ncbi:MAG: diguanylate cyclase, partial [Anaerolineae bacterium]|nr:diguanylate cyclase [Anaerolineae bacterium]
ITKPFDIQELRLRVRNAISRVAQQHMLNAVTELPEGALVEEHLTECIFSEREWAVLVLSLSRLSEFRELYGFSASDDVLRALALMIRNTVQETGREEDFIGHLNAESFLVVTSPAAIKPMRERVESRLQQSREYFYPVRDRQKVLEGIETDHLALTSASIDSAAGPFQSVEALLAALGNVAQT